MVCCLQWVWLHRRSFTASLYAALSCEINMRIKWVFGDTNSHRLIYFMPFANIGSVKIWFFFLWRVPDKSQHMHFSQELAWILKWMVAEFTAALFSGSWHCGYWLSLLPWLTGTLKGKRDIVNPNSNICACAWHIGLMVLWFSLTGEFGQDAAPVLHLFIYFTFQVFMYH